MWLISVLCIVFVYIVHCHNCHNNPNPPPPPNIAYDSSSLTSTYDEYKLYPFNRLCTSI